MLYFMVRRACHGIRYGQMGMAWYMTWSGGHSMIYDMAWRAWHGIQYSLVGMQCIWYDLAGMIYSMA